MIRLAILLLLSTPQVGFAAVPRLFKEKHFTSASFAEAVNHFVELGEEATIRELRELTSDWFTDFERGYSVNERIAWMCRILFEPKAKKPIRPPGFGGLSLPNRSMPFENWPLHPVARSGSTYFVLSEGYSLAGKAEDPKAYIEHCRRRGNFRKEKIAVPTKAQALQDAAALRKSKAWLDIKWKDSGWSYSMKEAAWQFIQNQAEKIP